MGMDGLARGDGSTVDRSHDGHSGLDSTGIAAGGRRCSMAASYEALMLADSRTLSTPQLATC
jgi:hypothetical protein